MNSCLVSYELAAKYGSKTLEHYACISLLKLFYVKANL